MAPSGGLGRLALWATTLLVLAPLWLGPALLPALRAVHEANHTCACGMAAGKCGCPTCARLEQEQRHGQAAHPVIKANCDDDGATMPGGTLPLCALQADARNVLPLDGTAACVDGAGPPRSRRLDGPPTPPPRT